MAKPSNDIISLSSMFELMRQKTFLLGLGSPKCGTTWLHDQLKTSSAYARGIANEYHIFDAITLPQNKRYNSQRKSI